MSSSSDRHRSYTSRTYGERRTGYQQTTDNSKKSSLSLIDRQYKRLIERTEKVTCEVARLNTKSSYLTKGLVVVGCETPTSPLSKSTKEYDASPSKYCDAITTSNKGSDTPIKPLRDYGSPSKDLRDSGSPASLASKDRASPLTSFRDNDSPTILSKDRDSQFVSKLAHDISSITNKDRDSSPGRSYRYRDLDISSKASPSHRFRKHRDVPSYDKCNEYGQITTEKEWKKLLDAQILIERAVELVEESMRYPKRFVYESDTPSPKAYHVPIGTKLIPNPDFCKDERNEKWKRNERSSNTTTTRKCECVDTTTIESRHHLRIGVRARLSNRVSEETIDTSGYASTESHESEKEVNTKPDDVEAKSLPDGEEENNNNDELKDGNREENSSQRVSKCSFGSTFERPTQGSSCKTNDVTTDLVNGGHSNDEHLCLQTLGENILNSQSCEEMEAAEDEKVNILLQKSHEILVERTNSADGETNTNLDQNSSIEEETNEIRFNEVVNVLIERSDEILEERIKEKVAVTTEAIQNTNLVDEDETRFNEIVDELIQRSDAIILEEESEPIFGPEAYPSTSSEDASEVQGGEMIVSQEHTEASILNGAQEILDDTETILQHSGISNVEDIEETEETKSDKIMLTNGCTAEIKTSILGRLLVVLQRLLAFLTLQSCRRRQNDSMSP